jgi:hypothetical protein
MRFSPRSCRRLPHGAWPRSGCLLRPTSLSSCIPSARPSRFSSTMNVSCSGEPDLYPQWAGRRSGRSAAPAFSNAP